MQKNLLRKGLAISLVLMLLGIIPIIGAKTTTILNDNHQKIPINDGIIFSDNFNDNTKDFTKWTEIGSQGEWWERNQQTEFRLYEESTSYLREGIESIDIPVDMEYNQLTIECTMDTFVDNYPDTYYQYTGQTHLNVVDSSDPDNNFIDVYYKRVYDQIIVEDSTGASITLGTASEFRYKVVIRIESDKYQVEVGPFSSQWFSRSVFPSEFDLRIELYILLAGDFPSFWWIAAFDDVVMSEFHNYPPDKPTIDGPESGRAGTSIIYYASTTDPDENQLLYWFDWGDETNSGWVGPYDSGDTASKSHIWEAEGDYILKVKAKDIHDVESEWSDPLIITMPRNRATTYLWYQWFLERFPILCRLLNLIK